MKKIIKTPKLFLFLFSFLALTALLFSPGKAEAAETTTWNNTQQTWSFQPNSANVVHSKAPEVYHHPMVIGHQMGPVVAVHAQNNSPVDLHTTLCAEQVVNGQAQHLGCVPHHVFASASQGPSIFSFNVWPQNVSSDLRFTYKDQYGAWRQIGNHSNQMAQATYNIQ